MTEAILKVLEEPPKLSENRGRFIRRTHCPSKVNKKKRRHSGWLTARWAGKGKYSEEINEGNDPIFYYDGWESYNDGMHYDKDPTHIRSLNMYCSDEEIVIKNKQIKLKEEIRRLKKYHSLLKRR